MDEISRPLIREIIEDFADDINRKKKRGATPSVDVIFFRNEEKRNVEREVWEVPCNLLRFRKDNGRIASDVLSYEKNKHRLLEKSEEAQKIIRNFLENKDPEKTKELINSIRHSGQRAPAIITADGFLINGNRRKVALEKLFEETKDDLFTWMKVIILPGTDDEGGQPTLKEIEQIENRYQLQSEGKSEYYNFDRALSIRRKTEIGMTLDEQLRDDPNYAKLSQKDFQKVVKECEEEYLEPLKCIDRYLDQLGRPGLYHTISTGISDREGRWQAFRDYYNFVRKKIDDDYQRAKMELEDDETGDVEEVAFKMIRKREFPDLPKVHKIMRDFPKWLSNSEAKKELFKLRDIDFKLPKEECYDVDGKEYDERKKDQLWNSKYQSVIINQVKKAYRIIEFEKERETPLSLLRTALNKLEHENMDLESINIDDLPLARELTVQIQSKAHDLEREIYELKKKIKKLKGRFEN